MSIRTFFATFVILGLGSTAALAQSYTGYAGYAAYETPAYAPASYYAAPQAPAYTSAPNYAAAPVATYTSTTYYAPPQTPAYTPAPVAVTYYEAPQAAPVATPYYAAPQPAPVAAPYYAAPQPAPVAAPVRHCHYKVEQPALVYPTDQPLTAYQAYPPMVQPTVAYQPMVQPTVAYQPVVQPTVAYQPQVYAEAQVAYRPIARYQPYVAATYVTAGYGAPAAMAPVPGAPRVVVHPKVYVQGEPVRNLIKAVTP